MFDINICSFPTTCRNIKTRCSTGSPTRLSSTLTVGTLPSSSYTSTRDASAMLTFIISCLFFSVVRALPTFLSRDVFDPPITSPSASTIWQVGQTVTVTWYVQISSIFLLCYSPQSLYSQGYNQSSSYLATDRPERNYCTRLHGQLYGLGTSHDWYVGCP